MKLLSINTQAHGPNINLNVTNFCGKEKSSLDILMTEAKKKPRLTPAQQDEFIKKAQAGDENAKNRVVESNIGLVVSIAKAYQGRGLPFADLVQEGAIGLAHAVDKFEPERGFQFSTYAGHWIRGCISNEILDQAPMIRFPAHVVESLRAISKANKSLPDKLKNNPKEIEKVTGINEEKQKQLKEYRKQSVESLDSLAEESRNNIPSDERYKIDDGLKSVSVEKFYQLLEKLPVKPESLAMFKEYYGFDGKEPKTFEEVGNLHGCGRENVRQRVLKVKEFIEKSYNMQQLHESNTD